MKYNIRINYITFSGGAMYIGWSAKNIGFGVLSIYTDSKDGTKFDFDTECMSDEFRDQVLEGAIKYMVTNENA